MAGVGGIIGVIVELLILYLIVRLGVKHGIRDSWDFIEQKLMENQAKNSRDADDDYRDETHETPDFLEYVAKQKAQQAAEEAETEGEDAE